MIKGIIKLTMMAPEAIMFKLMKPSLYGTTKLPQSIQYQSEVQY
ncbi:hypothetical protein [Acholeplasma equirhinis]|nr:hypothetical protein [Acholeplasma equirhinis]